MSTSSPPSTLVIDQTTILSLSAALALLIVAYTTSLYLLPSKSTITTRVMFVWHSFDALIHFIFEGSFLYHCFFTYTSIAPSTSDYPHPASLTAPGVYFLGHQDRLYGSFYGNGPMAKLWQEYAKADKRWGGSDLGVISLEILTVFGAGPIAAYVCTLLLDKRSEGKLWFWATVLATAELYGGESSFFSTFSHSICLVSLLKTLADFVLRLHNFCTGMADGKSQSGHEQFHVSVGVSLFLQHALGVHPILGTLPSIQQDAVGFCKSK